MGAREVLAWELALAKANHDRLTITPGVEPIQLDEARDRIATLATLFEAAQPDHQALTNRFQFRVDDRGGQFNTED